MPISVTLRTPAKINLTLRVGPRRPDGFHDVATLMQSIALTDTLVLTPRRGPFALSVRAPGVPSDSSNLIWRAAAALWRALGRDGEPRDAHVRLEKAIPSAAGLGGGSANAAGALVGLNRLWQGRLTLDALLPIAATIGADVPFFLIGGTAVGVGRGDELYPVEDVARLGIAILKPSFHVATADAYRWLDDDRAAGRGDAAPARTLDVGWGMGPVQVRNDLQASVARRHSAIDEMVDACLQQGAMTAAMTGSGSVVFGVFREPAARAALRRLQRPDWLVQLTRTLTRAEARRQIGLGAV